MNSTRSLNRVKYLYLLLAGMALVLVVVCSSCKRDPAPAAGVQTAAPWPMYRLDMGNSGYSNVSGPSKPTVLWSTQLGYHSAWIVAPVLGPDGTLYCSGDEKMYAIDRSGKVRWKFTYPGFLQRRPYGGRISPALAPDGTLYVATEYYGSDFPIHEHAHGRLYGLDKNGKRLWTYEGGEPQIGLRIDDQGLVYTVMTTMSGRDEPQYMTVLDQKGSVVRKVKLSDDEWWNDGDFVLRNTQAGIQVFLARRALYRIDATGTVSEGDLGPCLSPESSVPGCCCARAECCGMALDREGKALYLVLEDGRVLCVSPDSLEVNWQVRPGEECRNFATPAVSDNAVYAVSDSKRLTRITLDGKIDWKLDFPVELSSAPIVDKDENVYITGRGGKVFCVGDDGRIKWRVSAIPGAEPERAMSAPILGPDGTLYGYSTHVFAIGEAPERTGR